MTDLSGLPLGAAARRGLADAGLTSLEQIAERSRSEIAGIRGVGAQALAAIDAELAARGLAFGTPAAASPSTQPAAAPAASPSAPSTQPAAAPASTQPAAAAPDGPGYNPLAIIALLLSVVLPPAGVVFGHWALRDLARGGQRQKGREFAIVGLVVGYALTALVLVALLVWLVAMVIALVVAVSVVPGLPGIPLPDLPELPRI